MTSKTKCVICRTSTDDILNLGEMKTCENISAHYYCLLLASTIKQSGEDEEGILGFLPSDIKEEIKLSQKRVCMYCKRKGASVYCASKSCKMMFHLPCGITNKSGHQFHDRFYSHCRAHRPRQKFKKQTENQTCPICYESVDFENWTEVLCAPCCKNQSFFHKQCIQQMALSAGYFFKCPMCNNCELFQKTMKHYGVFIPDRDASWELEPHAFEDLLYRHTECNAKVCLCKSGRKYDNLGPWNIVLCSMCGSQGTHIHCSKLKKSQEWICDFCVIEKKSDNNQNNGIQPSTSHTAEHVIRNVAKPKKRKRNRSLRSSKYIDIDSDDSDVVVIEDEPNRKCLIAQDRTLLKLHKSIKQEQKQQQCNSEEDIDIENQDSSSCTDFMNLIITDVRSLSEESQDDNSMENKIGFSNVSEELKNMQNRIMFPLEQLELKEHKQEVQPLLVLQEVVYNNNNNNNINNNTNLSSSDDIVIID